MKKKRFTDSQIVAILKEGEAGMPIAKLCRKHGMSQSTYFAWKAKYAGMSVTELKRLKQLKEENLRLKRISASLSLDHDLLKEVC